MTEQGNPGAAPKALHPVREQLDELDGLLQRMMELPVEPAPEDPPFSHSEGEGTTPAAEDNGHSVALEASLQQREFPETTSPPFPDFQFSFPGNGSENLPARSASDGPVADTSPTLSPFPSPTLGAIGSAERREPAPHERDAFSQTQDWEREPSPWLWPLLVVNRAADGCLGRLGRPGRWFQRPWGRACLGAAGLLLLAAALLWGLLDWIQWTW